MKILSLENKNEIRENPHIASHLMPSTIEIDNEENITGVITGISGAEMGYGVRHTEEQLETGHAMILKFIIDGELPISPSFKNKKIYKFVERKRMPHAA